MRRPSPAMLVALTALVVAMSGTAVAATGGAFILGKSNRATSLTSLSNTKGTSLALSAKRGAPPLTVSNSVQVPKLNATELEGHHASAFLPASGTAANSAKLGGQPASDYMIGTGQISHAVDTIPYNNTVTLNLPNVLSNDYQLEFSCTSSGTASLSITANTNIDPLAFDRFGEEEFALTDGITGLIVAPTIDPFTVLLQVPFLSHLVTTIVSGSVNTVEQTCTYAAQSVSDG